MKKTVGFLAIILFAVCGMLFLSSCKLEETDHKKWKDLDYTICDERKLPDALVGLIETKRQEPFKLTYQTKDYLYVVVGYGTQDRSDLCIQLKEFYLTKNAIFVDTQLSSREDRVLEDGKVTCPWIAIKCERYDVPVIFK